MHVIQIGARLDDETKLIEGAAPLGQAGFVRRQIPGNNQRSPGRLLREDSAASQVSGLVDDRRLVTLEIGVPALSEFSRGTGRMAGITMVKHVDQVAAKSYQRRVLARQVQRDRCDLEADADFGLLAVVLGQRPRDSAQRSNGKHHSQRGSGSQSGGYLFEVHGNSPKDSLRCARRTTNSRSDKMRAPASGKARQGA